MTQKLAIVLAALAVVGVEIAQARTWKDSTGKYTIEAEFAGVQDGTVQLKKPDGSVIAVPLRQLSKADQQYVASLSTGDGEPVKADSDTGPTSHSPAAATAGNDTDREENFRTAQRAIRLQLNAKSADSRVAALRQLAGFPVVEAAELLVRQGLASPEEKVRLAAYESLLKFRNEQDICRYLQKTVATELAKGNVGPGTFGVLGVLLASDLADVQQEAQMLLDKAAEAGTAGRVLLIMLAEALGAQGDDTSVRGLQQLTKLTLFPRDFGFRRAVVQGLGLVRKPEAVAALVAVLPNVQGEVRADIVQYLTGLSGQQLGMEAAAWEAWWQANQATFTFPAGDRQGGPAGGVGAPGNALVLWSPALRSSARFRAGHVPEHARAADRGRQTRVDSGDRPTATEAAEFNVVVFNGQVGTWQSQLVPATPENQQAAAVFVAAQELAFATISYDALEAALGFDTEAIYFLTDGAPYGGKISQPAQIVAALSQMNRLRRVSINSIGIGVGRPGNAFDTFLRTLSRKTTGSIRGLTTDRRMDNDWREKSGDRRCHEDS